MTTQPGGAVMPLPAARPGRRLRATTVALLVAVLAMASFAACASGPAARSSPAPSAAVPTSVSVPARPGPAVPAGASTTASITSSTTASISSSTTAKHVFAAYRPGGAPTAGVTAHRSGSCFTSSITVAASNAYRCFAGQALLDPCFAAAAGATTLACYADPWHGATVLALTAPLPKHVGGVSITRPWAVELADGQRCTVATGTTTVVRGVALGYRCGTATAGLSDTSGPLWRALYRSPGGALRTENVRASWST